MSSDIDRVLERVRQNTERRMAELERRRAQLTPGVTRTRTEPTPGARVFDPASGEEGTVIGGGSENVVIPASK